MQSILMNLETKDLLLFEGRWFQVFVVSKNNLLGKFLDNGSFFRINNELYDLSPIPEVMSVRDLREYENGDGYYITDQEYSNLYYSSNNFEEYDSLFKNLIKVKGEVLPIPPDISKYN